MKHLIEILNESLLDSSITGTKIDEIIKNPFDYLKNLFSDEKFDSLGENDYLREFQTIELAIKENAKTVSPEDANKASCKMVFLYSLGRPRIYIKYGGKFYSFMIVSTPNKSRKWVLYRETVSPRYGNNPFMQAEEVYILSDKQANQFKLYNNSFINAKF